MPSRRAGLRPTQARTAFALRRGMSRAFMAAPLLALLACSHGSPTEPSSSAGGGSGVFQGRRSARSTARPARTSRCRSAAAAPPRTATGSSRSTSAAPARSRRRIRGSGVVDRGTTVNGGSTDRTRVSMIPSAFDLTAFNEMFRAGHDRLQRWTTRPALVVLATTMNYRNSSDTEFVAASEQMSEDEANLMIAHMTGGSGAPDRRHLRDLRVNRRRAARVGHARDRPPVEQDRRRPLQRDRDVLEHDRVRPVVGDVGRDDRRRGDVPRPGLRQERQPPAAAQDPRARPRARLPACERRARRS